MSKTTNIINYQTIYSSQIYLNSGNADILLNGAMKSNVAFFFPNALTIDKKSIELRLSVVNAQIPVSFYLINSTNDSFSITISGTTSNYVFPAGNYNVNTFMTALTTLLGTGWTISFNQITNNLIFSYTSSFTLSDSTNSIFPIIGFVKGVSYSSTGNSITSPYSVNFSGLTRVNIRTTSFYFKNPSFDSANESTVISTIPLDKPQNGITFYTNKTGYKCIFKNHEVSSVGIEIRDDLNNFIDFRNVDWSLTLQIDIVNEIIQSLDNLEDIYELARQEL